MRTITLVLLLIFSISLQAQTNVSGSQSGTWTLANSPYQVTGDITISTGQILTIEAGVQVIFQGHYKITLDGQIIANGTDGNLITFTATDHNIGWNGIRIEYASTISQFFYCKFEYGIKSGGATPEMNGGAFYLNNADAQFYNCIFMDNEANGSYDDGQGGAIYGLNTGGASQTLTKFIDCKFERNSTKTEGGAIKLSNDSYSEFTRCEFINNRADHGGGAIILYVGDHTSFDNCLFYMNSATNSGGGAIKTLQAQSNLQFAHCTFAYNSAYGNATGGACDFSYANVAFINSIIYGNSQQRGKDINIGQGSTGQIDYCDVDMPSNANGANNLDNVYPLFVSATDFHLQDTSPCIDAGFDIGRPYYGNAPDMGCYESTTSSVEELQTLGITIYPNPTSNFITITNNDKVDNISITDISGKTIQNFFAVSRINTSEYPTGIYFISFYKNNHKIGSYKLIVK